MVFPKSIVGDSLNPISHSLIVWVHEKYGCDYEEQN